MFRAHSFHPTVLTHRLRTSGLEGADCRVRTLGLEEP